MKKRTRGNGNKQKKNRAKLKDKPIFLHSDRTCHNNSYSDLRLGIMLGGSTRPSRLFIALQGSLPIEKKAMGRGPAGWKPASSQAPGSSSICPPPPSATSPPHSAPSSGSGPHAVVGGSPPPAVHYAMRRQKQQERNGGSKLVASDDPCIPASTIHVSMATTGVDTATSPVTTGTAPVTTATTRHLFAVPLKRNRH